MLSVLVKRGTSWLYPASSLAQASFSDPFALRITTFPRCMADVTVFISNEHAAKQGTSNFTFRQYVQELFSKTLLGASNYFHFIHLKWSSSDEPWLATSIGFFSEHSKKEGSWVEPFMAIWAKAVHHISWFSETTVVGKP